MDLETRTPIIIRSELPESYPTWTTAETIEHVALSLIDSLEIPGVPVVEVVAGPGRVVIGRRAVRLDDDRQALDVALRGISRLAAAMIDDEVVRLVCRLWFGEQPSETSHRDSRWILRNGVSLGYKLSRFRDVLGELVVGRSTRVRNRRALFEDAISGADCCRVRVSIDSRWPDGSNASLSQGIGEKLFEARRLLATSIEVRRSGRHETAGDRVEWNDIHLPALPSVAPALEAGLGAVVSHLEEAHPALVNTALIELYLLRLRGSDPVLADLIEKTFPISLTTAVIRELVADGISLDQFVPILTAMLGFRETIDVDTAKYIVFSPIGVLAARLGRSDLNAEMGLMLNYVRSELKRAISATYTRNGTMTVFLLTPELESLLASREGLSDTQREAFNQAVNEEIKGPKTAPPVILTSMEARDAALDQLRTEFPLVRVVSYQELSPDVNILPYARIDPDL